MLSYQNSPRALAPILAIIASCLLLAACTDKSDEATTGDNIAPDTGIDVEEDFLEEPSVESIDFDNAEPGTPAQIHIASSTRRGVVSATPPIRADEYLSAEYAREFLSSSSLTTSRLAGQTSSEQYNSVRYFPSDSPDIFGLALQIWKLDDMSAPERLEDLRSQFLNIDGEVHEDAPEHAFTSRRAGIRTFVFPTEDHSHIFALSCDTDHCPDTSDLIELGNDIANNSPPQ